MEQVAEFHAQVGEVSEYLDHRGINKNSQATFQLGYVHHSDNKSIVGRLAIPYLTPAGPVSIKYRAIDDSEPKYIYDSGAEPHLFNPGVLLTTDRVIVTEGELDVIAAVQAGVAAVGYPGTQNFKPHFRWAFDSVREIAVVADGDEPGVKAARKVAATLSESVDAAVRVVYMPDGDDTNSFLQREGDLAFIEKIGWI